MDTLFLAIRVIVSLGAVLGAMWLLHRRLTKRGTGRASKRGTISVAARQGLGGKTGIAIVDAGGRRYLLGVTEQAITVLDRLDADEPVVEHTVVSVTSTGPVRRPAATVPSPQAASFERELAAATAGVAVPHPLAEGHSTLRVERTRSIGATAAVPVLTAAPTPPLTRRALRGATREPVAVPVAAEPGSRRALREAQAARPTESPIAGSILSPGTWRQTAEFLRRTR